METTYQYEVEEDNKGSKPKWWVIKFPVERPQDRQRHSRHDTEAQATEKLDAIQHKQG